MADLDAIREALERLTLLITGEISEEEYQRLRRETLELLDQSAARQRGRTRSWPG